MRLLLAAALYLLPTAALSTTYTVTLFSDLDPSGNGTTGDLRWAINSANADASPGPHTIVFAQDGAIALQGPLPLINTNLILDGRGPDQTAIDGGNQFRVLFVRSGTVTIRDLTVRNGRARGGNGGNGDFAGGGGAGMGGGLLVHGGAVQIINVVFRDNRAEGGKGGDGFGGVGGAGGGGGAGGNGGHANRGGGGGGGLYGHGGSAVSAPGGGATSYGGGGGGGLFGNGGDGGSAGVGSGGGGGALATGSPPGSRGPLGGSDGRGAINNYGGAGGGGGIPAADSVAGGFGGGGGGHGSGVGVTPSSAYGGRGGDYGGGGGSWGTGDNTAGFGGGGGGGALTNNGGSGGFGGGGGAGGRIGLAFGSPGEGGTFGGSGARAANNEAPAGGGGGAGLGGAIFVRAGTLGLENVSFVRNLALGGFGGTPGSTGAGQGKGGAVFLHPGTTITAATGVSVATNYAADAAQTLSDNYDIYGAGGSLALSSGDGQSAPAGGAFQAPLAVVVRNALGIPVSGIPVSFSAPANGATAVLASTTAVSRSPDGIAAVTAWAGVTTGSYQVTATLGGATVPFHLQNTVGAPASLVFTAQPGNAAAGVAISPVSVSIRDAFGNVATGAAASVALAVEGPGPLSPGSGSAAATVGGVATFPNLAFAAAGNYRLVASATGLFTALSAPFTISPAAATRLTFVAAPDSVVAGEALPSEVTVAVEDSFGNAVFDAAELTLSAEGPGPITEGSATTAVSAGGVASFAPISFERAGNYRLVAAGDGLTGARSSIFYVAPAAPAIVAAGMALPFTEVGQPFATPISVLVEDAFGNRVPGVPVNAAGPEAGASAVVTAAGVTDASGTAWLLVTANDIIGAYALTVTAGDATGTVSLENVGIPTVTSVAGVTETEEAGAAVKVQVAASATVPTGEVILHLDGAPATSGTLEADGTATLLLGAGTLTAGTSRTLEALYTGDTRHQPSASAALKLEALNAPEVPEEPEEAPTGCGCASSSDTAPVGLLLLGSLHGLARRRRTVRV